MAMFNRILMVCTGNVCRSPMAECMAAASLRGHGIAVGSAGTGAPSGAPADPHAIDTVAAHGLDLSGHRARQATSELLQQYDLILTAESSHARTLTRIEPAVHGRVYRIGHWLDIEVPDPVGQPREAFEETFELLQRCLQSWMNHLLPRNGTYDR